MSAAPVRPYDTPGLPADFARLIGATAERERDAETFRRLLVEANSRTNLVGASTLGEFWARHFLDSAQLVWFAPEALTWADLGAGAGLPGIVLAILMKGRPGAQVHLVESVAKRCRFLAETVAKLDLPARVHHARAESLALRVDVVTARACAPLDRLLGFAEPHMAAGGLGLFLKGHDAAAEIETARGFWRFDVRTHASFSDPRGQVLAISGLARAPRR